MSVRKLMIGVIGAGEASEQARQWAYEIGRLIAWRDAVLVCGGMGGVMEEACRGCIEAGGQTMGILPGAQADQGNPWVSLPVVTDLGHARNVIIAHTARALVAVEGEYGTLSEIAIALKLGRPVTALGGWRDIPGVMPAVTPRGAVSWIFDRLGQKDS